MACSIQDLLSGGGFLPHVYCKNITLYKYSSSVVAEGVKVRLNIEILQSRKQLLTKNWLTKTASGAILADYIYINILPFLNKENISKLDPSFEATKTSFPGNVYVAAHHPEYIKSSKNLNTTAAYFPYKDPLKNGAASWVAPPSSVGLFQQESHLSFMAGTITLGNIMRSYGLLPEDGVTDVSALSSLFFREETRDGEPFYVFSFEYDMVVVGKPADLGIFFVTYANGREFMLQSDLASTDEAKQAIENMSPQLLLGPANTEIVFENGKVKKTRKQFYLPDGDTWDGAVHLHACGLIGPAGPAPDGYCGDGKAMGGSAVDDPNPSESSFRGWMAGEKHPTGESAPKLRLLKVPNYMVNDLRVNEVDLSTVMGLTMNQQIEVFSNTAAVAKTADNLLSPFQKETKKYLTKFDNPPGLGGGLGGGVTLYDSDSEFSKLYITRDKQNNARGIFIIDFERLLRNNSALYPLLDSPGTNAINYKISSCLAKSKLLELKVYRDRVNKRPQGITYEKYANDTAYEEPSYLVGTISDSSVYGTTSNSGNTIKEISLSMSEFENQTQKVRTFMFTDKDVGQKTAGLYQYRVEMSFKDGTYYHLNSLLTGLVRARTVLQQYYNFSLSSYALEGSVDSLGNTISPSSLRPYFRDGSFDDKFLEDATSKFPGLPWTGLLAGTPGDQVLVYMLEISTLFNTLPIGQESPDLSTLLNPTVGSPQGIDFVIKTADAFIDKLQKLLGSTKVNKTGSEIDTTSIPNNYKINNFFGYAVSSSDAQIEEFHTFDSPTELHKALSNEDIYVDYLSNGAVPLIDGPDTIDWGGPVVLSQQYLKDRLMSDAARLYPPATNSEVFYGNIPSGIFQAPAATAGTDSLSFTGHSYLMPSIIELSEPGEKNISFNFFYNALNNGIPVEGYSVLDYDKIVVALLTYSFNKEDVGDADLLESYYRFAGTGDAFDLKEAYKNLFNEIGMTVHDAQQHDTFFDKESGAGLPIAIENIQELADLLASSPEQFSDTDLHTENYYKKFFSDQQNVFNTPVGRIDSNYNKGLPNIYKFKHYVNMANSSDLPITVADPVSDGNTFAVNAVTHPGHEYNSYLYLHVNLMVEVQIYTGKRIVDSPMKFDDENWKKLSQDDLAKDGYFLCRTVLYNEKLAYGLNLPIINNYFILTSTNIASPKLMSSVPLINLPLANFIPKALRKKLGVGNSQFLIKKDEARRKKKTILSGPGTTGASPTPGAAASQASPAQQSFSPSPGGFSGGGGY